MKTRWILLAGFSLLVACSDGATSSDCGTGETIDVSGATYCVYQQAVVVENGFECPTGLPNLFQGGGVGICTDSANVDPDRISEIRQKFREKDPTYLRCQLDVHCSSGETCINQVCSASNPNNTNNANNINNTNNTNNTTSCQTNDQCDNGQICNEAVCKTQCGGFAGFQCADNEWCDYDDSVQSPCGIADGGGLCEPRPNGCDDVVELVCGCDNNTYENPCSANDAGFDINGPGACN